MQDMITIFAILFGVIALETIILIFTFIKTPVGVFLKASFLKQGVMYIIGKDRIAKFITFKKQRGTAKCGKDGLYKVTENSATIEKISKCPLYLSFRDFAATLEPEYPAMIQELRESGYTIETIEDLNKLIVKAESEMHGNFPVTIKPYKTYKIHQLTNMFPYNLEPTFIEASVQYDTARGLRSFKSTPMVMGGVIVLMIVGALAVYILRMAQDGQLTTGECEAMVSAAKCVATSVTDAAMQALANPTI